MNIVMNLGIISYWVVILYIMIGASVNEFKK
jgi:hypothetical protein